MNTEEGGNKAEASDFETMEDCAIVCSNGF